MPKIIVSFRARIVVSVSVLTFCTAAQAARDSLCSENEDVLFSCSVDKRLVSFCSAPGQKSLAIQYRFGLKDKTPEAIYPNEAAPRKANFRFSWESRSAKGGLMNLQFKQSDTVYTLYRYRHAFEGNYAGITMAPRGKPIVRLECKESSVIDRLDELERMGLPPIAESELVE